MNETLELYVKESGQRLDKYLGQVLTDYTRSFLQKQIEEGNILINGIVQPARYKVKQGDSITVNIPEPKEVDIIAENIIFDADTKKPCPTGRTGKTNAAKNKSSGSCR